METGNWGIEESERGQKGRYLRLIRKSQLYLYLSLCLAAALWPAAIFAQQSSILNPQSPISEAKAQAPLVKAVGSIGMTVAEMDRSIEFYTKILSFEKVSDVEVWGSEYEHLQGVFGLRIRLVRLALGSETIELTEYLTPKGKPFPIDSRGNDQWFQHVAIIVHDMGKAYDWLRKNKVQHASTGPQRLPDWNPNAGGIEAFYFRDPDGHFLEILHFPTRKGDPK